MPGVFITFEGVEGSGKSTQVKKLRAKLEKIGQQAVVTREPGGAVGAEEVRALLVQGDPGKWTPLTELLLHSAARADHMARTIRPALDEEHWVVSDRHVDSTVAYQGYGQGVDLEHIYRLQEIVTGGRAPDLTFIFDLDVETGLRRTEDRSGKENRYELMDPAFHERMRAGYLCIAQDNPQRCVIIDASQPEDVVEAAVWKEIWSRFGGIKERAVEA